MNGAGEALPLRNKLLYASEMVGNQAVAQTRNLWLLFFLAPPVSEKLPSAVSAVSVAGFDLDARVLIALVLTGGRIIEAFDDPIIGWWSDRTKSRWGRRIPFVLLSTPFYGLFFALLWFTPWGGANALNAIYIFVVLELFFLFSTLSAGPYEAMLPELARGHRDRVSVVGWQFYFGLLGGVLGLVASGFIIDSLDFKVMGGIIALFGIAFRYIGLAGVWDRAPRDTPPAEIGLIEAVTSTLRNRQFLFFLPTFVLFQTAMGMVLAWVPFMVSGLLGREDEGRVTSMLTGAAIIAMALSAIALWRLGNTKGKRWVYSTSMLIGAGYLPFLFFLGMAPGIPVLIQGLVMAFLVGVPMAGVNLLPKAITADITDYDEIRTGMRREAMFYATQNLFEKIASSFSPFLLSLVLTLGDTADDPLGIRLVGPVAGVIAFMGFWLFRGYRLPSEVTVESVREAGLEIGPQPGR